jgi:hypothetical protein
MGVRNTFRFRNWVKIWGKKYAPQADSKVEDVERFRNEFRDGYNECFPQKKVKIRLIDIRKP